MQKILSGSLQSLLANKEPELLVKAKSEVSLSCTASNSLSAEFSGSHAHAHFPSTSFTTQSSSAVPTPTASLRSAGTAGSTAHPHPPQGQLLRGATSTATPTVSSSLPRAKSLEALNCGAMWSSLVEEIVLHKGEKGLGFSILDYQDPQNMSETVIVIRSLIPGGVAFHDRRLVPGDRLVYVNELRLDNASLDMAVQALKGAPFGAVRLGIGRPLSVDAEEEAARRVMAEVQQAEVILGKG